MRGPGSWCVWTSYSLMDENCTSDSRAGSPYGTRRQSGAAVRLGDKLSGLTLDQWPGRDMLNWTPTLLQQSVGGTDPSGPGLSQIRSPGLEVLGQLGGGGSQRLLRPLITIRALTAPEPFYPSYNILKAHLLWLKGNNKNCTIPLRMIHAQARERQSECIASTARLTLDWTQWS